MTLVTAVVEPFKLDGVRAALLALGVPGLTVSKSSGDGRQRGHTEVYRGAEFTVELLVKVLLEVLVDGVDRRGRLAPVTVWLIDKSRGVGVVSGVLDATAGWDRCRRPTGRDMGSVCRPDLIW